MEYADLSPQVQPLHGAKVPDLRCPNCQQCYRPGEFACNRCGKLFADGLKTTRMDDEPSKAPPKAPIGAAFAEVQQPIVFEIDGGTISLPIATSIIVGRTSEITSDTRPDVCLNAFRAGERGVSRQHVLITRDRDLVHVCDLGSTNGTYLNGRRLIDKQRRLLRSGDELMLGRLRLQVRF